MHVLQRRMKWPGMSLCKQCCHVAFSSLTDRMHCENGRKHLEETDGRNRREKRQINTTSSVWWTHSDHAKDFAVFRSKRTHGTGQRIHSTNASFKWETKDEVRQQNNMQHHKWSPISLLLSLHCKVKINVSEMCFWILRWYVLFHFWFALCRRRDKKLFTFEAEICLADFRNELQSRTTKLVPFRMQK